MALSYNRLTAGRRLERIAALSDGVFAIAMTPHRPRDPRARSRSHTLGAGALECAPRARPSALHVPPQFPHARDFLEWPADAAEPVRHRGPGFELAPAGVSGQHCANAVLDLFARGVHHLPAGVAGVLGEHLLDRSPVVSELDLRDAQR